MKNKPTKLHIDVYVNGRFKIRYNLCADNVKTLGPEWDISSMACGEGAVMRVDIPITIS